MATLQQFDTQLFSRLFESGGRRRLVRPLSKALSRTGDGYLHLALPAILLLAGAEGLPVFAILLGTAMAVERIVYLLLKNTLKRRRPEQFVPGFRSLVQASDQFSFPSGHTSAAFCLATATGIVFGGPFIAMYLWAGAVGLSRVLLGVHFPGDVLAGAVMGSSIAVASASQLGLL